MRSKLQFAIVVFSALTAAFFTSHSTSGSASSGPVLPRDSFLEREDAYRHNNLGVAYLEQFEPSKAAVEFRQALAIDSSVKIAQVNLAIALFYQQGLEGTRVAAEKAESIAPELLQTHYLLGLIPRNENLP